MLEILSQTTMVVMIDAKMIGANDRCNDRCEDQERHLLQVRIDQRNKKFCRTKQSTLRKWRDLF